MNVAITYNDAVFNLMAIELNTLENKIVCHLIKYNVMFSYFELLIKNYMK